MTDDERAIRALIDNWMQASRRGDLETVLSLMADDVVFRVPGREPFGKAEFAKTSQGMKDVRVEGEAEIVKLKVLGDWAWLRNHLRIAVTPPNGTTTRRSGYTLTVLRKNAAGRWVLARDANLVT
ncbi:MAG TPA: SgcJ/EcaC family oxidoreductase [Micropepsaceae bacterium]|nr:SgcJ/EcaC family oxidoreductase [Micropepsaceae bacterium]